MGDDKRNIASKIMEKPEMKEGKIYKRKGQ